MKRSAPMKRTPFRTKPPGAAATPKVARPKLRTCAAAGCRERFVPRGDKHRACSGDCSQKVVEQDKSKAARIEAKRVAALAAEDKRTTRTKLEAMKPLKELKAEAQAEFNRYIRLRDRIARHGCICCGAPLDWNSGMPGGAVDAGHFMSRGSSPELAFDERNVSAQRKSCNRPGGTTREKFRAGMVARWGEAVVVDLEGPHAQPHLKHDDYRQIRDTYKLKARALEKGAANDSTMQEAA